MKNLLILIYCFFQCNISLAELKCSRQKVKILYINGVSTTSVKNDQTTLLIRTELGKIADQIDKNSEFSVEGIYNASRGLHNDIHELKAGLEEMRSPQKAGKYWRELAKNEVKVAVNTAEEQKKLNKKIDEAFDQIYGRNYQVNLKTKVVDQEYFTKTDLFAVLSHIDYSLANIVANAAASEEVIEYLKNKIVESFDNGQNKVMVIAHSQGNAVLSNAESRTYWALEEGHHTKHEWYQALSGHVQLAPPTHLLASSKSQHIRLDADSIINGSPYVTGVDPLTTNYTLIPAVNSIASAVAASNNLAKVGDRTGHFIEEIYLSDKFKALRISDDSYRTMINHFKENVIEVANKFESNCETNLKLKQATCIRRYVDGEGYEATGEIYALDFSATNATHNVINMEGAECQLAKDNVGGYSCYLGYSKKASFLINAKAIGGDVINFTANNPCYAGRSMPNSDKVTYNQ